MVAPLVWSCQQLVAVIRAYPCHAKVCVCVCVCVRVLPLAETAGTYRSFLFAGLSATG